MKNMEKMILSLSDSLPIISCIRNPERMKKDDGTRLGMDDVFGKDYKPVDDGYVPEFE